MLVRVERAKLAEHLDIAAHRARDLARTMVIEALPDPVRFRLSLRAPFEKEHGRWVMFERDVGRVPVELSADEVVEELWREGRAPEWIDVHAAAERGDTTLLHLQACPRFGHEPTYHGSEGIPPFHVVGPPLPPGWTVGDRFSIHRRYDAVTERDVEHLSRVAERVVFLRLRAECALANSMARLPSLPRVACIDVESTGELSLLDSLSRHPALTRLDVTTRADAELDARALPPRLASLSLEVAGTLRVLGAIPPLRSLRIRASRLAGELVLPRELESLSLSLPVLDDTTPGRVLAWVERVESLHLRGTPISEMLARWTAGRLRPRYLDLGDTGVDARTCARSRASSPRRASRRARPETTKATAIARRGLLESRVASAQRLSIGTYGRLSWPV